MIARLMAAVTALLIVACSSAAPAAERFTGVYTDGFEMQAFTADGRGERWWVNFEPEARKSLDEAKGPNPKTPFGFRMRLEIEGRLSTPGHYGHLGAYPRIITITRVISAAPERP